MIFAKDRIYLQLHTYFGISNFEMIVIDAVHYIVSRIGDYVVVLDCIISLEMMMIMECFTIFHHSNNMHNPSLNDIST